MKKRKILIAILLFLITILFGNSALGYRDTLYYKWTTYIDLGGVTLDGSGKETDQIIFCRNKGTTMNHNEYQFKKSGNTKKLSATLARAIYSVTKGKDMKDVSEENRAIIQWMIWYQSKVGKSEEGGKYFVNNKIISTVNNGLISNFSKLDNTMMENARTTAKFLLKNAGEYERKETSTPLNLRFLKDQNSKALEDGGSYQMEDKGDHYEYQYRFQKSSDWTVDNVKVDVSGDNIGSYQIKFKYKKKIGDADWTNKSQYITGTETKTFDKMTDGYTKDNPQKTCEKFFSTYEVIQVNIQVTKKDANQSMDENEITLKFKYKEATDKEERTSYSGTYQLYKNVSPYSRTKCCFS